MNRELTYEEAVLFKTVNEFNMDGKRPMYGQIDKAIRGKIRETPYNKRRLALLVREGYLKLEGKRYYNPELAPPVEDKPDDVRATESELLFLAEEDKLLNYILSLRTNHLTAIPSIVEGWEKIGLTTGVVRRLQILINLLRMMREEPKEIPTLPVKSDKMMTDFDNEIKGLVWMVTYDGR